MIKKLTLDELFPDRETTCLKDYSTGDTILVTQDGEVVKEALKYCIECYSYVQYGINWIEVVQLYEAFKRAGWYLVNGGGLHDPEVVRSKHVGESLVLFKSDGVTEYDLDDFRARYEGYKPKITKVE